MRNNKLPLVLLSHQLPTGWISKLADRCELVYGPPDAAIIDPSLMALLPEADGLLTLLTIPVTAAMLEQAASLRVVSNMAVGVDNIDVSACTRRGIPVGNTPGVLTESTADLTLSLILSITRKIPQASLEAKQGKWKTWLPAGWLGMELNQAILGIIGMGKIGKAVARRAAGFGMKVIYTGPNLAQGIDATRVSLEELLRLSDIISLHAPLTPETRKIIDGNSLSKMKNTTFLINAARGSLVDTDALVVALQQNRIAGAALDVTDPEPLPPDHPLYQQANCLVVPHIGSATLHTRSKMAELACDNLLAGLNGERLPNCVNPEVYHR